MYKYMGGFRTRLCLVNGGFRTRLCEVSELVNIDQSYNCRYEKKGWPILVALHLFDDI